MGGGERNSAHLQTRRSNIVGDDARAGALDVIRFERLEALKTAQGRDAAHGGLERPSPLSISTRPDHSFGASRRANVSMSLRSERQRLDSATSSASCTGRGLSEHTSSLPMDQLSGSPAHQLDVCSSPPSRPSRTSRLGPMSARLVSKRSPPSAIFRRCLGGDGMDPMPPGTRVPSS